VAPDARLGVDREPTSVADRRAGTAASSDRLPRVAILVHGSPGSAAGVRARGLTRSFPADRILYQWRERSRAVVAREWHRSIRSFAPDVLYVMNTAMPGAVLACWWRVRAGLPFVLDTGDVIYEMARRAGTDPAWKLPLLWAVERMAESWAHTIVTRGTRHREYLERRGPYRVEVIRDGYSPATDVDPVAVTRLRRQLGLEGAFVVGVMGTLVYSPTLGICYGWDLVQALAQLPGPAVKGLVIGDGNGLPWLQAEARRLGVADRLVFVGRIPYEHVPLYLRLLDVAISTQTNNLAGQVRTTGKLPEYMATARFVVASRVGEASLLLPDIMLLDYAGEIDPLYPSKLAGRVRALLDEPALLEARHSLPEVARRLCSYEVLSEQFIRVVRQVEEARRPG
jgi:glycosyltransferase involved in cell wall biosynthesis